MHHHEEDPERTGKILPIEQSAYHPRRAEKGRQEFIAEPPVRVSSLRTKGCSENGDYLETRVGITSEVTRTTYHDPGRETDDWGFFDIHYFVGQRWGQHVDFAFDNMEEFLAYAAIVLADGIWIAEKQDEWEKAKPADWNDGDRWSFDPENVHPGVPSVADTLRAALKVLIDRTDRIRAHDTFPVAPVAETLGNPRNPDNVVEHNFDGFLADDVVREKRREEDEPDSTTPVGVVGATQDEIVDIDGHTFDLINVHNSSRCEGRPCTVHNRTDHHMRTWPVVWRNDRGIFERTYPEHGVGHPDPDQFDHWQRIGESWQSRHGCCGCCRPPEETSTPQCRWCEGTGRTSRSLHT